MSANTAPVIELIHSLALGLITSAAIALAVQYGLKMTFPKWPTELRKLIALIVFLTIGMNWLIHSQQNAMRKVTQKQTDAAKTSGANKPVVTPP